MAVLAAVTALILGFHPLLNAGGAVGHALAQLAEDGLLLLWHDDLLADDTEGVGENFSLQQLVLVDDSVLVEALLLSWFLTRGFCEGWDVDV